MNVSYRVLLCNRICHSQALNLHVPIGKDNVTASFYPGPFLTSVPFPETSKSVRESESDGPKGQQVLLLLLEL